LGKGCKTKINKRIGEKLLVWQSKIHRRFVIKSTGVFFWITAVLFATILTVYVYFIRQATFSNPRSNLINPFVMGVIVSCEVLVSITLIVFTYREKRRAQDFANRILCPDAERSHRATDY